jgi:hypothetical protein
MQTILNELNNKVFTLENKRYQVLETSLKLDKIVIKTDKRSFVLYKYELEDWIAKIEIINIELEVPVKRDFFDTKERCQARSDFPEAKKVSVIEQSLQAEIIVAETNASKVSEKLMEVFNALSENPTESTYKKAAAMVNVSNSIVNVQIAQIKFLSLKK